MRKAKVPAPPQCSGNGQRFSTKAEAVAHAKNGLLVVYRHPECNGYHLTKLDSAAKARIAELLVEVDGLRKGLIVTRPSVDFGSDLYFLTPDQDDKLIFQGVNAKVADRRRPTWSYGPTGKHRGLACDVLALVDISSGEIRYSDASERLRRYAKSKSVIRAHDRKAHRKAQIRNRVRVRLAGKD